MSTGNFHPKLHEAIERVTAPNSHYWLFRKAGSDRVSQDVEIRLNLPADQLVNFRAPDGWRTAMIRSDIGAVFLRREQMLTDDVVTDLLSEATTLAFERGGKFHSWQHAEAGHLKGWAE